MSRSAITGALQRLTDRRHRRAFCSSAALAVGAVVTTPALIRAYVGTRLTSPVATTSRRVPPIAAAELMGGRLGERKGRKGQHCSELQGAGSSFHPLNLVGLSRPDFR
jgi:hypothetical protein